MRYVVLTLLAARMCGIPIEDHTLERKLDVGGKERTYLLHVPPNLAEPAPLLLAFHGGGSNARAMEKMSGFDALSDKEGFLVAYPESLNRNWNDGRAADATPSHRAGVDDLGFIDALLKDIASLHSVDEKRVYATGISNGAILCHYLAAKRSSKIAAIAPVVGGMPDPFHKEFKPTDPVSVLVIQSTEDPLVPYDGGAIARDRGRVIATDKALQMWVEHDGCEPEASKSEPEDRDPNDGCRVKRCVWGSGKSGTEVVLLKIEGGGHTWPNGAQYLPERRIGRVCRDFDDSLIWAFFRDHPKKP